MNFGLIVIGDEILSGRRQDKHLPRVIELLGARGIALSWARYTGDERARITALLREAFASGDAVFSCGGIGATPDDHTRQCAAAALGVPLQLHAQARELIVQRMRDVAAEQGLPFEPQRPDNLHRLNMGVFPQGATLIPNPYNKIPGFSVGSVHFLPGFPVMAWPMIEWLLDTSYRTQHGQSRQSERSLIVYGSMEAVLTPLMPVSRLLIFCDGLVALMPTLIVRVNSWSKSSSVTTSIPRFWNMDDLAPACASRTSSVSYCCSSNTSWRSTGSTQVSMNVLSE
ncbi:MAG TPA: molybdopterin-binding protein [Rubrivivax sp.]|nr:molybdopterin-binding protein [Rubrivivax sp.]